MPRVSLERGWLKIFDLFYQASFLRVVLTLVVIDTLLASSSTAFQLDQPTKIKVEHTLHQ